MDTVRMESLEYYEPKMFSLNAKHMGLHISWCM